jgi:hypothetical protein
MGGTAEGQETDMRAMFVAAAFSVSVVSGFPPALRSNAAELRRDQADAQDAKAGGRTVAQAPEMTRVPQFENDRAVSWKSVIPPHTESTLHRHDRYRTVIGIVGGDLTTIDSNGKKTVTHYDTGKSYWQTPMPPGAMHKDVNETGKTIELVVVEMK